MKGKDKQKNRNRERGHNKEPHPFHPVDLSRVEFHRHGLGLIPHPGDRGPGVALMVGDDGLKQVSRFCSCPVSESRTCLHMLEISRVWKSLNHGNGVQALWDAFKKSLWHRFAEILAEGFQCTRESVRVVFSLASASALEGENRKASGTGRILKVVGSKDKDRDALKFSRLDLFRLKALSPAPIHIRGNHKRKGFFESILAFKPFEPFPPPKGMITPLRPYQRDGMEWLGFLYENGLGGLLCDEMGLGKTHEAMAFVVCLLEQKKTKGPFLVVSPTTVLSHWERKLSQHVPRIKAAVYHGGSRDIHESLKKARILLTTYGVLRRDIDKLRVVPFAVAIFDEIQYLKNPETQAYQCAREIDADMKLGLTGTPIENRLQELKALLDLTVPGYLGNDRHFHSRYLEPVEKDLEGARTEELRRVISPVTLRRRKETVLRDLPPKIEDVRTCMLSEDQVRLYREAVDRQAPTLLSTLKNSREKVPYIHIFALLTLLKQICDHPALLSEKKAGDYESCASGKWVLFEELLAECLDSGQKVVVYSQFLGMIEIMEKYLQAQGIGFVSLTGKSRNRGEIVSKFNEDPDCKVYVGSLKAGGTGIDLVAASVVIHYDRWWNAAKEDQATDRVHRIGQRRGVQVFKLVTEGTLEEKIAAIIEKKRRLMESVVKENDPSLLKTFTREELIQLLTFEGRSSAMP